MDGTEYEYEQNMLDIANFTLTEDCLTGAALGIAKQIVARGWNSLTQKQQDVFTEIVVPAAKRDCQRCGNEIETSDLELGGIYCGWCQHQVDKSN